MKSTLVSKNVTINGRRTSLRLEEEIWEALADVCRMEGLTLHALCTMIDANRHGSSRTSAVRAFVVTYFRTAARQESVARSLRDKGKAAGPVAPGPVAPPPSKAEDLPEVSSLFRSAIRGTI